MRFNIKLLIEIFARNVNYGAILRCVRMDRVGI